MSQVKVFTKDDQEFVGDIGKEGYHETIDYCYEWMLGEALGIHNADVLQLIGKGEVHLFFRHDIKRMTVVK